MIDEECRAHHRASDERFPLAFSLDEREQRPLKMGVFHDLRAALGDCVAVIVNAGLIFPTCWSAPQTVDRLQVGN
jgi:hypothetical protein